MLVIITEDSKSGYEFWNSFKRIVCRNSVNVEVAIARPANHISFGGINRNRGGITNVKSELNYQIMKLSKIPGKHLIFLAIDFTADPNSATLLNVKNLITYVNRIKSGRVDKFQGIDNVAITYSRYFCYEEIFLSFKYLTEFCGVKYGGNSLDMQKARRIHHILHNYFVTVSNSQSAVYSDYLPLLNNNNSVNMPDYNSDLYFLYKKYKRQHQLVWNDMKNREVVASLCLEYISSVNSKYLVRIDKSGIGYCWFLDCGSKGELKNKLKHKGKKIHNMDCSDCFLCENCQLGRSKMGYLLTNSLFKKQGLIDINSMLSYI